MTIAFSVGGTPHNAFDIDADAAYLYLAVLDGSTPKVLKMLADLSAAATVSYNPGGGTEICLMAGDYSPYFVWAAGAFSGTDKVVRTTDGGVYWVANNPATWIGVARPILVTPGDDFSATTSTGLILQSSYTLDDAVYWVEDFSLHFPLYAIDKMDDSVDEVTVGVYWYSGLSEIVNYSPNFGVMFEDITKTLPTTCSVTTIISGRRN